MVTVGNKRNRLIYAYLFPDLAVYIGLAGNQFKRGLQHKSDSNSPVKKYSDKTDLEPELIYLTKHMPENEASEVEKLLIADEWRTKEGWFKDNGFYLLNVSAGGSLGGRGSDEAVHSKENILKSALCAFQSGIKRTQWEKANKGVYMHSYRNGYSKDIQEVFQFQAVCWHKDEVVNSAKSYYKDGLKITEWRKNYEGMSNHAYANGYFKEIQAIFKTYINPIKCINTGKVYKNSNWAAKELNIDRSSIYLVLKGKLPHTRGYKFEYVNKNN
jgi:predicted GIY-YIG superfamily endonuclease